MFFTLDFRLVVGMILMVKRSVYCFLSVVFVVSFCFWLSFFVGIWRFVVVRFVCLLGFEDCVCFR